MTHWKLAALGGAGNTSTLMAEKRVHIAKNGKAMGPFTQDEIARMRSSGALSGNELAWKEGQPSWVPLSELPVPPSPPPIPRDEVSSPATMLANGLDGRKEKLVPVVEFFTLTGRIGRASFVVRIFVAILGIGLVALIARVVQTRENAGLSTALAALVLLCVLAVQAGKRLHDIDSSARWLFAAVTGLGMLILPFVLLFATGTSGANRFGAEPTSHRVTKIASWIFGGLILLLMVGAPITKALRERPQEHTNLPLSANPSVTDDKGIAQRIYADYASSVVTITTFDEGLFPLEQGTGVIFGKLDRFGPDTMILTNFHVIKNAHLIVITTKAGTKTEGALCYFDEGTDLALLAAHQVEGSSLAPPASAVETGARVFAIGAPSGLGWTISEGIVSARRTIDGIDLVQTTAPISPGSSGGPLYNASGELVGITSFKSQRGENLNFAIRITPKLGRELARHFDFAMSAFRMDYTIGHYENTSDWMANNEKAKLWNDHTAVIDELQHQVIMHSKEVSQAEKAAETKELARWPTQRTTRGGVLSQKLAQACLSRFEVFPNDSDGWMGGLDAAPDEKVLDELLILGINQWPHDPFVFETVMQASCSVRPDWTMQIIENTADSLPSRKDVESLLHEIHFREPAEDAPNYLVRGPEQLAKKLRSAAFLFGVLNAEDGHNKFTERIQAVNQTLNKKGWKPPPSEAW